MLDITDQNEEFKKLNDNLRLLERRFIALTLDYTQYIDNSLRQEEFYKLRDSITYRFFSAQLQTEFLIRQHTVIEHRFEELLKKDPLKVLGQCIPSNPYFDYSEKEISSIFDSFLYHLVSAFDYLGTLTNYICGPKNNKQETLKWTNLTRSSRDGKNHFGKKPIAEKIKELDNNFVNKLYGYRSILIHEKAELSRSSFNVHLGSENNIIANFIATERLIKHFSELKKMSTQNEITIKYVAFWIMNKAIVTVTELLFALKTEMELNPKVEFGILGYHDSETNRILPASTLFWKEENPNSGKNE